MFRVAGMCLVLVIVLANVGFCQSLFNSVLGPNGLGIYGGSNIQSQMMNQFNHPQFLGVRNPQDRGGLANSALPGQTQPPWPVQGQNYSQTYNQGMNQMGQQQYAQRGTQQGISFTPGGGVYADWYQNVTPQAPAQPQYTQPAPAPRQPMQAPVQPQYTQPAPAPRRQVQTQALPRQRVQPQMQTAAPGQPPLRPGQYARRQPAPTSVDDLPPGAVRVTTITPEGTSVQTYPPAGTPMPMSATMQPGASQVQQGPRRLRAKQKRRTRVKRPTPSHSQSAPLSKQVASSTTAEKQHIAMPTPVAVPQNKDPRIGWGRAVKRAPKTQ
jgi:hypothetical protein